MPPNLTRLPCEDPDVLRALREYRETYAIIQCCDKGHSSALRVLLENAQYTVWATDKFARDPLTLAAVVNDITCVEVLLEYGYDVNTLRPGHQSALGTAADGGYLELVELLLFKGASVTNGACLADGSISMRTEADPAYDGEKWSAAAAVARLLIERGISLDIRTTAASENFDRFPPAGSTARDIADACPNADVRATVLALIDDAVATRDAARAALVPRS